MYAEVASTFAIVMAVCVIVMGMFLIYKTSVVRDNLNARIDEVESRFDRLIYAINKANYSEYLNEVKQEETLGSIMRKTGIAPRV